MKTTRYEDELLIHCARTIVNPQRKQRIVKLVTSNTDWLHLYEVAKYSHVRPLLANNLINVAPEILPSDTKNFLLNTLMLNIQRNLLLTAELLSILETFEKNDIKVLPLKGITLAENIYHNISLREFGDLDLLVSESNLNRCTKLLEAKGYVHQITPLSEIDFVQPKHHHQFIHTRHNVCIELHWKLAGKQHLSSSSAAMLWSHAETTKFENREVLTPSYEDLLLYLCMHGYRHIWQRLSWIVDVCELLRVRTNLDWSYISKTAKEQRNWRKLALGLKLAHKVADGDLPDSLLDIAPLSAEIEPYVDQIWQNLFLTEKPKPTKVSAIPGFHFETLNYHLIMSDTASDRFRYLRYYFSRWLTPMSGDRAVIRLPKKLSFLYFPIRVGRLISTYGFVALRTVLFKSGKQRTEK